MIQVTLKGKELDKWLKGAKVSKNEFYGEIWESGHKSMFYVGNPSYYHGSHYLRPDGTVQSGTGYSEGSNEGYWDTEEEAQAAFIKLLDKVEKDG